MGKMTMRFKGGGSSFTVDAPSEAIAESIIQNAEVVQEEDSTPDIVEVQIIEVEKIVEKEIIKEVEKLVYVPEYIDRVVEVEKIVEKEVIKEVEKLVDRNVYIPTIVTRDIIKSIVPPHIYMIIAAETVLVVSLLCYILK
jgi:glycine cleavage system pyridoxal-binding protein P